MIVVLRSLNLGDLLVAVPALRALRRQFPDERVVLACGLRPAPLMAATGCVDEVLALDGLVDLPERLRGAGAVVNLHGTGPRSNQVLDALDPVRRIGHAGHGWSGPSWLDGIHERERWCRLLDAHGIPADPAELDLPVPDWPPAAPGAVLVHPGAGYGSKRWPADRFAAVARVLRDRGHRVAITGSPGERALTARVAAASGADDLGGALELPALAATVAAAELVICGDTGVAHLASAYRTPSVVLFGPVSTREWGPPPGPHIALSADHARRGDPFADDPDPALLGVGAADVLAAARDLLP
ncbi:glycosyltransferase family 9 protein [Actinokineospora bangkokensis]|uniref:glycosyltransferase family 9 protein n=1 Tax=Actinokineospora bangkokensis TaxID=1193682 RepID=UPI000ADC72B4|nr:glycosyltransferase family 9 protein [Actinokineospora bangkokensis]